MKSMANGDSPRLDPDIAAVAYDDARDAKQLSPAENADLCAGCVQCCTYLTIEIDAPRVAWEYDQWIWALHHEGIELYVERPERWFLHVGARCRQLTPAGRCGIHGHHPVLCREHDPRSCERRYPLSDLRAWFHDAGELEAWIRRERPAHWARLAAHRDAATRAASAPTAGFVALAALTRPSPGPRATEARGAGTV